MTVLGISLLFSTKTEDVISRNDAAEVDALFAANSGIQVGIRHALLDYMWDTGGWGNNILAVGGPTTPSAEYGTATQDAGGTATGHPGAYYFDLANYNQIGGVSPTPCQWGNLSYKPKNLPPPSAIRWPDPAPLPTACGGRSRRSRASRGSWRRATCSARGLVSRHLCSPAAVRELARDVPVMDDDLPLLEYFAPRDLAIDDPAAQTFMAFLAASTPCPVRGAVLGAEEDAREWLGLAGTLRLADIRPLLPPARAAYEKSARLAPRADTYWGWAAALLISGETAAAREKAQHGLLHGPDDDTRRQLEEIAAAR